MLWPLVGAAATAATATAKLPVWEGSCPLLLADRPRLSRPSLWGSISLCCVYGRPCLHAAFGSCAPRHLFIAATRPRSVPVCSGTVIVLVTINLPPHVSGSCAAHPRNSGRHIFVLRSTDRHSSCRPI